MIQHAMTQRKSLNLAWRNSSQSCRHFLDASFGQANRSVSRTVTVFQNTLTEFKFLRGPAVNEISAARARRNCLQHFASCTITACSFALHDLAVVGGKGDCHPCLLEVLQIFTVMFMGFPPKNIIRSYKIHMKFDQHVKCESEITHRKSQAPDHFKKLENES